MIIKSLSQVLTEDEEQFRRIKSGVVFLQVDEATELAKSAPEIGLEELYGDVYATPIETKIRGITPFDIHDHLPVNKPINL